MWRLFCLYLFLISPSFGAFEGLVFCFLFFCCFFLFFFLGGGGCIFFFFFFFFFFFLYCGVSCVSSLILLYALLSGTMLFSWLCPVCCLIGVYSGSCLALWSPCWGGVRVVLFTFLWSVACVISLMVCLLFLLVSLVGYVLWLFLDIFFTTVEPQWLEHLWDHGNLFEIWVVRATEGLSWCPVRKQMTII